MTGAVEIDIAVKSPDWADAVPAVAALCRRAANAALGAASVDGVSLGEPGELSLVLADDALVRELNRGFRGQDRPTNVLSFPALDFADQPIRRTGAPARDAGAPQPLGDVVIALETARREAVAQHKPLDHHLCHLVVHGTLHLLGYDHEQDAEAERMERLEALALARIGVPDPYRADAEPAPSAAAGDDIVPPSRPIVAAPGSG